MKRINKSTAKSMFNSGQDFFAIGCNILPDFEGAFSKPQPVQSYNMVGTTFDQWLNEFTYYNYDKERGYYPHYFIKG